MANSKISALTAASTPLAGTETLPVVQSGVTKKVAVSDLTAGRTVSMAGATLTGLSASAVVWTDGSKNLATNANLGFDGTSLYVGGYIVTKTNGFFGGILMTDSGASTRNVLYLDTSNYVNISNTYIPGTKFYANYGTQVLTLDTDTNVKANVGNFVLGTNGKGLVDASGVLMVNGATTTVGNITLTNNQQFASPTGALYDLGKAFAAQTFKSNGAVNSMQLTFTRQCGILYVGVTDQNTASNTLGAAIFVKTQDGGSNMYYTTLASNGWVTLTVAVTNNVMTLTLGSSANGNFTGCFVGTAVA